MVLTAVLVRIALLGGRLGFVIRATITARVVAALDLCQAALDISKGN